MLFGADLHSRTLYGLPSSQWLATNVGGGTWALWWSSCFCQLGCLWNFGLPTWWWTALLFEHWHCFSWRAHSLADVAKRKGYSDLSDLSFHGHWKIVKLHSRSIWAMQSFASDIWAPMLMESCCWIATLSLDPVETMVHLMASLPKCRRILKLIRTQTCMLALFLPHYR